MGTAPLGRKVNNHRRCGEWGKRMDDVREHFQNLHEFLKVARFKLNRNNWDYIVGGTETETTLARNRQSLDQIAFKPRVLRNVQNVDCSSELFGRKVRLPVLIAPVGGLQQFWDGGVATVAEAAGEFGIPMMQSSATEPPLEEAAKRAPDAFKIFQLYVRGDDKFVDDFYKRSQEAGFAPQFCFTVDLAHYSRRERDTVKRHDRIANRSAEEHRNLAGLDWARSSASRSAIPKPRSSSRASRPPRTRRSRSITASRASTSPTTADARSITRAARWISFPRSSRR